MTTRFTLFRSTLAITVATAATLLTIAGSAAPAAAAEGPRSVAIDVSGIDLASPAGHARIEAEIGRVARRICSTNADRGAAQTVARNACIKSSLAAAMPALDSLAAAARDARTAVADAAPSTASVMQ
jgi:UrcA family protein